MLVDVFFSVLEASASMRPAKKVTAGRDLLVESPAQFPPHYGINRESVFLGAGREGA